MRPTTASDVSTFIVGGHAACLAQTSKLRLGGGANTFWCCPAAPTDHKNEEWLTVQLQPTNMQIFT